jgi:hypothetical protein
MSPPVIFQINKSIKFPELKKVLQKIPQQELNLRPPTHQSIAITTIFSSLIKEG